MPILILGSLGILFAVFLTFFSIKFKTEENPLISNIYELMPKANCGACGVAGCSGFAELLAEGKASPDKCSMLTSENFSSICSILGLEAKDRVNKVAKVKCFGGLNAKTKFEYKTVESCNALNAIFGTNLECTYGCLGLGDCVSVCPVDAIKMKENGLPDIDIETCTGCGQCVTVCPAKIIELQPKEKVVHISCSSCDRGPAVLKVCKVGCIGCGKCVRVCPQNAITIKDNLAVIDYEKCDNCGTCIDNCPRKIIFSTSIKSEQLA
ncbi:RnfABCDGE type electron transport complex subunit B [bacterium]|nr:RnfABCDGE type electron transport complex subunit B [bacterium]